MNTHAPFQRITDKVSKETNVSNEEETEKAMFCKRCGEEIEDFCDDCGDPFDTTRSIYCWKSEGTHICKKCYNQLEEDKDNYFSSHVVMKEIGEDTNEEESDSNNQPNMLLSAGVGLLLAGIVILTMSFGIFQISSVNLVNLNLTSENVSTYPNPMPIAGINLSSIVGWAGLIIAGLVLFKLANL